MILMFAACSGDTQSSADTINGSDNTIVDFGEIAQIDANRTGRIHGISCTDNQQCKYNTCYSSPNITGEAFMICTKDCTDVSLGTCGDDDANGIHYTAVRWGQYHPEEKLTCMCVPSCNNLSECTAIDPRYNACKYPGTGARNVCMYLKTK